MYNLTFLKKYLFKALFPKKCRFFGNKVLNCIVIPSIPIKINSATYKICRVILNYCSYFST